MENLKENQVKVQKEILKPDRNFFHLKRKNKERKSKLNQEQPEEKKYQTELKFLQLQNKVKLKKNIKML